MKVKLSSVVLLIVMLCTSNFICSEAIYAEDATTTGITSVLAGGDITVAVKDNGEVYVWGDNVEKDYAVIDVSKGFDSISPDYELFSKTIYRPYYLYKSGIANMEIIDGAMPSKSINVSEGISLSVDYQGRISLYGKYKSESISWYENLYESQQIQNDVKILTNVKEVSEGQHSSIGINNDGSVIAWGDNYYWEVTNARNIFPVKAVAAGYNHLACLKEDGTVVVTGYNYYNQGGVPEGLKNVKDIAAGDNHTVALKEDGTVSAWGSNDNGQCNVPHGLDRVVAIAAGSNHTVALRDDGTIVAWGRNVEKQCNVLEEFKCLQEEKPVSTNTYFNPTPTPGISTSTPIPTTDANTPSYKNTTFKQVIGAEDSLCGITKDGKFIYWGSLHRIDVETPLFPGVQEAKSVSVDYYQAAMLDENGRAYMAGYNAGYNNAFGKDSPEDLTNIKSIDCGQYFTVALKEDGTVLAWGENRYGQCKVPQNLGRVKEIACGQDFVLALKEDGTLKAWGSNEYDECKIPEGLTDIKSVTAFGHHSLALKSDGTVISIGNDWNGAFVPPQGLSGVKAIACSYFQNAALKEDGTVVVWGDNIDNAPKDLKNVKQIIAGYNYMIAIREDGSTVKWGTYKELNTFPDTLIIEDPEKDIIYGDLNLDDTVNSIDLAFFKMYLLGLKDSLPVNNGISAADLNGDGSINSIDFALLRKYILGMIYEFPVSQMNLEGT